MTRVRGTGGMPPASACPEAHLKAREARAAFVRRGTAASIVTTMLVAVSHTVGGGPAPAPSIVFGMMVLLIAPSALLLRAPVPRRFRARRTGGLARIALTTIAAQLAFHAAFSALGDPLEGSSVVGGHHHGAIVLSGGAPHVEDPGMFAAHAVAALTTIAILAYGESVIRRGARWIRRAARVFAPAAPLRRIPRVLASARLRIREVASWTPPVGLRGPPVFS
ncbi:hypothetical protein GCM10010922_23330 [Microbacterium sorbitolivorans]|nr:hypothetical protein GCM10010922_23330 [Microbacterium sorbitolivorans]